MRTINEAAQKLNTPFAEWLAKFESHFPESRRRAGIAKCGTPAPNWSNKQRNAIVRWLKEDEAKSVESKAKSAEVDGRFIATRFVERLTGSATTVMRLRFIHDSDRTNRTLEREGTLAPMWQDVLEFQKQGYGCFYFLNEIKPGPGSGKDGCATDDDVTQIRALAIDSDSKGRPDSWPVQPSIIVCTSTANDLQKVHGIWPVVDLPVDQFALAQQRLAAHYGSDPSISNPSRVLRLPGTWHLKDPSKPQLVTFEDHSDGGELWEYVKDAEDILAGLPELLTASPKSAASGVPVSVEHVRTLLGYIDAGMRRDDWLKIVAGIHATSLTDGDVNTARGLAVAWSRGELDRARRYKNAAPAKYTNDDDVLRAFDTLPPKEEGTAYGTVLHYATEAGYQGGPYRGDAAEIFQGALSTVIESVDPARNDRIKHPSFPDLTQNGGMPRPTMENTRLAIQSLGVTCSHDVFHDRMLLGGHHIGQYAGEISDNACLMLRNVIRAGFNFEPTANTMLDAAKQLCLKNCFDPVCDYLAAVKWDGMKRIDRWLVDYMGAPDTPFVRAVGRLALIAGVRRVRKPGTKFDQIIVLEGPEGINKSTAIEVMAGKDNFSDQTILGLTDREQQERVAGKWLYEIADLTNIGRTDVDRVKAFASRTHDRARPAYGRTSIDQPRRCIFFATTNNDTYLQSQTGNRRFWSIRTASIEIDRLRADRDQLWAEAAQEEAAGVSVMLPRALWAVAAIEQAQRLDVDPWEDRLTNIKGWVTQCADARGHEERVASNDLLARLLPVGNTGNTKDFIRLKGVMRKLGWDGPKEMRIGNERAKSYWRATKRLPEAEEGAKT